MLNPSNCNKRDGLDVAVVVVVDLVAAVWLTAFMVAMASAANFSDCAFIRNPHAERANMDDERAMLFVLVVLDDASRDMGGSSRAELITIGCRCATSLPGVVMDEWVAAGMAFVDFGVGCCCCCC